MSINPYKQHVEMPDISGTTQRITTLKTRIKPQSDKKVHPDAESSPKGQHFTRHFSASRPKMPMALGLSKPDPVIEAFKQEDQKDAQEQAIEAKRIAFQNTLTQGNAGQKITQDLAGLIAPRVGNICKHMVAILLPEHLRGSHAIHHLKNTAPSAKEVCFIQFIQTSRAKLAELNQAIDQHTRVFSGVLTHLGQSDLWSKSQREQDPNKRKALEDQAVLSTFAGGDDNLEKLRALLTERDQLISEFTQAFASLVPPGELMNSTEEALALLGAWPLPKDAEKEIFDSARRRVKKTIENIPGILEEACRLEALQSEQGLDWDPVKQEDTLCRLFAMATTEEKQAILDKYGFSHFNPEFPLTLKEGCKVDKDLLPLEHEFLRIFNDTTKRRQNEAQHDHHIESTGPAIFGGGVEILFTLAGSSLGGPIAMASSVLIVSGMLYKKHQKNQELNDRDRLAVLASQGQDSSLVKKYAQSQHDLDTSQTAAPFLILLTLGIEFGGHKLAHALEHLIGKKIAAMSQRTLASKLAEFLKKIPQEMIEKNSFYKRLPALIKMLETLSMPNILKACERHPSVAKVLDILLIFLPQPKTYATVAGKVIAKKRAEVTGHTELGGLIQNASGEDSENAH